jgi:hypothetical protein
MSGESGCFRGDYACVLFYFARKAAGALGARHSLRPLISEGGTKEQNSGEITSRECETVPRHCEEESDEAIHSYSLCRSMDCFASPQ